MVTNQAHMLRVIQCLAIIGAGYIGIGIAVQLQGAIGYLLLGVGILALATGVIAGPTSTDVTHPCSNAKSASTHSRQLESHHL